MSSIAGLVRCFFNLNSAVTAGESRADGVRPLSDRFLLPIHGQQANSGII